MPAVNFKVQWPDGEIESYYSPSTVIHNYLNEGSVYPLRKFETQVLSALENASERVREKYGYTCSAATDEAYKIQKKLNALSSYDISSQVTVLSIA